MSVPVSAPSLTVVAILAGSLAGVLFLLPRLAASAPALALPLSLAGLFSAAPLLCLRISGRRLHAALGLAVAVGIISLIGSSEDGLAFAVLFGLWALISGEVLARRRSVIMAGLAGLVVLSLEALLAGLAEGTAPIEATLKTPQVQASFDQWAAQAELEPAEARTAIERVRQGIVALYPALSVISAMTIVALNAIVLARAVERSQAAAFPKGELLGLRWPLALVAAFVGSGALLLVPGFQEVAWNGLVVTLFLFLLQGLSVMAFALARLLTSGLMRALLLVTSLLGPWAILLSLLGLFDQWFDFRSRLINAETPAAP